MNDIAERPYCAFSRPNGDYLRYFKLGSDGVIEDIGGSGNDNERFWVYDGGILYLLSNNKQVTSCFSLTEFTESQSVFEGYFMEKIPLKIVSVKNRSDLFPRKTKYKSRDLIDSGFLEVGDHTYGKVNFVDRITSKLKIGDYCSIAFEVMFIGSNHRIDFVSTYPFKTINAFLGEGEIDIDDHATKGNIVVGNDVWIGYSAKILSGVTIGDGAVIAAGSVVTKDVEPYSIVAGNPGRHKKYRIEDADDRRKMQAIAWWDWSEEKVSENIDKIVNPDIKAFIEEFYVEKKS